MDDNSLANHVTDLHTVLNTCDECNHEFPTANLFNKHQQTCLFEPRCFPCQKCESVWSSNASLRLHYSENHQESVDVCGVCGCVVENSKVWQYGLWNFQEGGTKLESLLHKNQHTTQRKSLNFEFWINGELSKNRASFLVIK